MSDQFTTDNTEGFGDAELQELNSAFEQLAPVFVTIGAGEENDDRQNLAEKLLSAWSEDTRTAAGLVAKVRNPVFGVLILDNMSDGGATLQLGQQWARSYDGSTSDLKQCAIDLAAWLDGADISDWCDSDREALTLNPSIEDGDYSSVYLVVGEGGHNVADVVSALLVEPGHSAYVLYGILAEKARASAAASEVA